MLVEAYSHYRNNFITALAFALLLAFIPVFALFGNANIESGSIIIDYSLMEGDAGGLAIATFLVILFILFYSMFTSTMIFAVRKDTASVKLKYRLIEQIEKFSFKIFLFYVVLSAIIFAINVSAISFGIGAFFGSVISFVVAAALIFVPQSIVIDEFSVKSAIAANFDFVKKNPGYVIYVFFVGLIMLSLLVLAEYAIDNYFFIGHYLTPIVALVFIVPFIECLKSVIYLRKFDLLVAKAD